MNAPGPYQLQAAIAGLHGEATVAASTDWHQIALLYGELERLEPSPVVVLNRAIAVGHDVGFSAGMDILEGLGDDPRMAGYQPYHAARAELLASSGDLAAAIAANDSAIALAGNPVERAALEARAHQRCRLGYRWARHNVGLPLVDCLFTGACAHHRTGRCRADADPI